jgi:hypothetical protein
MYTELIFYSMVAQHIQSFTWSTAIHAADEYSEDIGGEVIDWSTDEM